MSSRPKPKTSSSRGDRERSKEQPSQSNKSKESVRGSSSRTQERDAKKAKDDRKDDKKTSKSGSSGTRGSGYPDDRASGDEVQPLLRSKSTSHSSSGKRKGPALSEHMRSGGQKGKGKAMPSTNTLSDMAEKFDRYILGGGDDLPFGGGGGFDGKKEDKKGPGKNRAKGKRGPGRSGGGGGSGDPGDDPPGGGSYTIRNEDDAACILPNSGLPTELRQKVYSYMLDHRVVAYDSYNQPKL